MFFFPLSQKFQLFLVGECLGKGIISSCNTAQQNKCLKHKEQQNKKNHKGPPMELLK